MAEAVRAPIPVDIGWHADSEEAALAFLPPEPLDTETRALLAPPGDGPGAPGLGERLFQIRCPFSVRIRITPRGVRPVRFLRVEEDSTLSESAFQGLFTYLESTAQRRADTPVLQLSLNFLMLTEEACTLNLLPPFLSPGFRDWPGTLVSGRFPLRSWPRALNAVLEWQDRDRDWVLRRGDPLAYFTVSFDDPRKVPRLVEAATTPAFRLQFDRISGVVEYARNVAPMFAEAERRRPARLLTPKRTGTPAWDD